MENREDPIIRNSGRFGSAQALLSGLWPLVLASTMLFLFYRYLGTGVAVLDAATWPGALHISCTAGSKYCAGDGVGTWLRIFLFCAAAFPAFNKANYFRVLGRMSKETSVRSRLQIRIINYLLYWLVVLLALNIFWVFFIYYNSNFKVGILEIVTLIMFATFTITDVIFMRLHGAMKTDTARVEFDYFFGSTFFINLPTLLGVLVIMQLSTMIIGQNDLAGSQTEKVLASGGIVMHVIISQIAFAFLQVQLGFNRMRSALAA